jgi:hypothetical protein
VVGLSENERGTIHAALSTYINKTEKEKGLKSKSAPRSRSQTGELLYHDVYFTASRQSEHPHDQASAL